MSHLGLVYSTVFANQGFEVTCYVHSQTLASNLQNGKFPINEPNLVELGITNKHRIMYVNQVEDTLPCDLAFISLDVETDEFSNSNLKEINKLIDDLDSKLPHNVPLVILSQIPVGFCDARSKSMHRTLIYQVETLVFGNAVNRAIRPERVIIGLPSKTDQLPTAYLSILETFNCPILVMNYKSAELCKMAINLILASSITSTNFLSAICEIVGANWNDIVPALKLDPRIGEFAYLKPGLGISGGNLERDIFALRQVASSNNSQYEFFTRAIQEMSQIQKRWPQKYLKSFLENSKANSKVIGLWGLSYKENTDSIKNSPSIEFLKSLPDDVSIKVFDPAVNKLPISFSNLTMYDDQMLMLPEIDALFILTPWSNFRLKLSEVLSKFNGSLIVDPHRCITRDVSLPPNVSLFVLGYKETPR